MQQHRKLAMVLAPVCVLQRAQMVVKANAKDAKEVVRVAVRLHVETDVAKDVPALATHHVI